MCKVYKPLKPLLIINIKFLIIYQSCKTNSYKTLTYELYHKFALQNSYFFMTITRSIKEANILQYVTRELGLLYFLKQLSHTSCQFFPVFYANFLFAEKQALFSHLIANNYTNT